MNGLSPKRAALAACAALLCFTPNLTAQVLADYRSDYQTVTPKAGWQYLQNKNGPISDTNNYSPLLWNGNEYDTDGVAGFPGPAPGVWVYLGADRGHTGSGYNQAAYEVHAIAAYTMPTSGEVELSNAFVTGGDSGTRDFHIRINNNPPTFYGRVDSFNTLNFNIPLGSLSAGDTIYFAVGPTDYDYSDTFLWDFTIGSPEVLPTVVWTNMVHSESWSNPANWSPNRVPGVGDHAIIVNTNSPSGQLIVQFDAPANIGKLTLGGTTNDTFLSGTNSLTVSKDIAVARRGSLDVGNLTATALNVHTGGVVNFVAGTTNIFSLAQNRGFIFWNDAVLNPGCFNNESNGLFSVNHDRTINFPVFQNRGTFRKTSGSNTLIAPMVQFRNEGVVEVQSGMLSFNSVGGGGTYDTANGTTILIPNGTSFKDVSFTGTGTNLFQFSDLTLNGTLGGNNGITMMSGNLWGNPTFAAGATFHFDGSSEKRLRGKITNHGTITWSGTGNLVTENDQVVFHNAGVFEMRNDQWFSYYYGGALFTNSGIFRKVAAIGTTTFDLPLKNTGTLDVQSGIVSYQGDTFFAGGSAFTGSGTNWLSRGSVYMAGSIDPGNLQLRSGCNLYATNTTFIGSLNWFGGGLVGPLTVAANGGIELQSGTEKWWYGAFTNDGTITWRDTGNLMFYDSNVVLNNKGTFRIENDAYLTYYYSGALFTNSGTVLKTGATNITYFDVPVQNTGILQVDSGLIRHNNGSVFNDGSVFVGAGTNLLNTGTVQMNGTINPGNVRLEGATISGAVTMTGMLTWISGNISADVNIAPTGGWNIGGSGDKYLYSRITNAGTINWDGASHLYLYNGSTVLHNAPEGKIYIHNDYWLTYYHGGNTFTNAGLIQKLGGTGTTVFEVPLGNSGTVDVQSGTIRHANGSYFTTGSVFSGPGTNLFSTGTITIDGTINPGNVLLNGSTIAGNATFTGALTWLSGNLSATLNIATNGGLNLIGSADRTFYSPVTNAGTINWSGPCNLVLYNASVILNNLPGGLIEASNAQWLYHYHYGGYITNAGTIRKIGNTNDIYFDVPVFNTGTLDAQIGRMRYRSDTAFYSGSTLIGAGTNLFYTGTTYLYGTIDPGNLVLDGAHLNGNATLTGPLTWQSGNIGAALNIETNGGMNIVGTSERTLFTALTNAGTVDWVGPCNIYFRDTSVVFNNLPSGSFNISSEPNQGIYNYYGGASITNAGTINKDIGTNYAFLDVLVFNSGTLNVDDGYIRYANGSVFHTGSVFSGAGTNLLNAGDYYLEGTINPGNIYFDGGTIRGTTVLTGYFNWNNGAQAAFWNIATNGGVNITGPAERRIYGRMTNSGSINYLGTGNLVLNDANAIIHNNPDGVVDFSNEQGIYNYYGGGVIHNAGLVRKQSAGNTYVSVIFENTGTVDAQTNRIEFTGGYTQTNGVLNVGISSLTNYGKIHINGTAPLTGTLSANLRNGYEPLTGDSFTPITYHGYNGAFTNFTLPDLAAWQTNNSIYGPNSVTLTILNIRPTLALINNQTNDEETVFAFTASALDSDVPPQSLTYSIENAPSGATINPTTGAFSWTPSEEQGPSTNSFTVRVTDNGSPMLNHAQVVTMVVNEVNEAPTLTPIANQTINELAALTLTNAASDVDSPVNPLTFELLSGPTNMTVDAVTGVLAWTPTEAQGPSTNTIVVRVIDTNQFAINEKELSSTNTFTIVVNEVNTPPVLTVPSTQTLDELATLTVTNFATDGDLPLNGLTFSLVSPPSGMAIDPATGVVTWTPTEAQGPITNTITVMVVDLNSSAVNGTQMSDTKSFTIIVNELNVAPVLTVPTSQVIDELTSLNVSANASDTDEPTNSLAYAIVSAPSGVTINASNGAIAWTPSEVQGRSTNTIIVKVTDNNPVAVNEKQLSATNSFEVVVNEINVAPVLTLPATQTIDELTVLNANATATDTDEPANAFTFALVSGPSGLTVGANGAIAWTPSEADGPSTNTVWVKVTDNNPEASNTQQISVTNSFQVVVREVNVAPTLIVSTNRTMDELTTFTFTNLASDVDAPANTLTLEIVSAPDGVSINPTNGVLVWTPTEAQGPSTNLISIRVVDDGSPSLATTNSFELVVNEVNLAPALTLPLDATINESAPYSANATATDADLPTNSLTFALVSGPDGLTVSSSGAIAWAPTEAQGPSTNTIIVRVTDNGSPALSVTNSYQLIVAELNSAPVLNAIADYIINPGATLVITNSALDSDLPSNTLVYSLVAGPGAMAVDSASGLLSWRSAIADADSTNTVSVTVTDGMGGSDLKTFTVIVAPLTPVNLSSVNMMNGVFHLTVDGMVGPDYTIQGSTTLTNWTTLLITNPAAMPFEFTEDAGTNSSKFFRVLVGP